MIECRGKPSALKKWVDSFIQDLRNEPKVSLQFLRDLKSGSTLKSISSIISANVSTIDDIFYGSQIFCQKKVFISVLFLIGCTGVYSQIDNNGCLGAGFGIDAGLYSNIIEYGDGSPAAGSRDWFYSAGIGLGTIDESDSTALTALLQGGGNPVYEVRTASGVYSRIGNHVEIDALFSRDYFGGSGFTDNTGFASNSKNGDDPALWTPGASNILGKSDLIDIAGYMVRDGISIFDDLWFYGVIQRADPGGSAHVDFEFFVEDLEYTPSGRFTSGGPDLGHTAYEFDAGGNITRVGDFLFNTSLLNGGEEAYIEVRLWVSLADYNSVTPVNFSWGPEFDGTFNGSSFGYASIIANNPNDACGIVNLSGQNPKAPPWGTLGTKDNIWDSTYNDFSLVEVGLNMTAYGMDHSSLTGVDSCYFPFNTFIVKSRSSASFTSSLQDYAGPFQWGDAVTNAIIIGDTLLSCLMPQVTLVPDPSRTDIDYEWTTLDGNIVSDPYLDTIIVDRPGLYTLSTTLSTGCPIEDATATVQYDVTKSFFEEIISITTVSCNGNDGSIDITVSGGSPPYTFLWSHGSTDEDPGSLPPGNYIVTITDAIPCQTISDTIIVAAGTPATINDISTDVDCFGNNTGAIDLSVSGQVPITFLWSNGSISEDISNLFAGIYTVTTTDADGCTETSNITVSEPSDFTLSIAKTDDTDPDPGINNGTIDLTVNGATPLYTYDWDDNGPQDPDSDTQDLSGLSTGIYTVTVTDANACRAVIAATIYEPEICDDGIDNDGDGLSDCSDSDCIPATPGAITPSNLAPCVGDTDITYTIAAVAGVSVYQWTVPAGATITAGQGTVSITVSWTGTQGGQICVQSDNVGCLSIPSCITVSPDDVPVAPGTIIVKGN